MDDPDRIVFAVVLVTLVILLMMVAMGILMMVNANRRLRHRAQLAELARQHDVEVMHAEREATQQTLREVGRELHDNVGQLLTVAQLGLNNALEEQADARLGAARDALDHGIEEVRRLGHSLNSDLWRQRSLADAISAEAERIERVGRVRAHVVVHGELPALPADSSTLLFRVFQEVVNNALKHSGADTISIVLDGQGPLLTITDNGAGFDAAHTVGNGGLVNIRKRCALIGFDAECISAPGRGCTWRIQQKPDHGA
jgi:two-component system, NarL family, sensor kinase